MSTWVQWLLLMSAWQNQKFPGEWLSGHAWGELSSLKTIYLCYFYSQVSWLEQLKDWPIWVSEEWRNDRHPYREVGLDRLCTRIETHQQLPRNSARLLYAANEEEAGYLTSVGSIVGEQSQAVVSPEEKADMSEQLLQAPIPWLPCHDGRDPGTVCMTVYHILA